MVSWSNVNCNDFSKGEFLSKGRTPIDVDIESQVNSIQNVWFNDGTVFCESPLNSIRVSNPRRHDKHIIYGRLYPVKLY